MRCSEAAWRWWWRCSTLTLCSEVRLMARSYAELSDMAKRFSYRLAKSRDGSQHCGMPVRYLLEDKNGVTPFRSLEDVERKLSGMALERAKRRTGF